MLAAIRRAYSRHLRGRRTEASLVATLTYFATLVAVRVYTTMAHAGQGAYFDIGGAHIHHSVFGVLALLIAGLLGLDDVYRLPRAALFGSGAALVLDEFALLVFLKDVHWLPQGGLSIVAILVGFVALAVNAWRSGAFFREVASVFRRRA